MAFTEPLSMDCGSLIHVDRISEPDCGSFSQILSSIGSFDLGTRRHSCTDVESYFNSKDEIGIDPEFYWTSLISRLMYLSLPESCKRIISVLLLCFESVAVRRRLSAKSLFLSPNFNLLN